MAPAKDYYTILGLASDATTEEIKRSFRRLAHRYHPDRNASRKAWAEKKMRLAIEAYRVLGQPGSRARYDSGLRQEAERQRDPYRERLLGEKHRPASLSALILYDLMGGRADEALAAFEQGILEHPNFHLADHLSPRDWLDCTVLLAEQYERRGRHAWALELYESAYASDLARKRYGEFFLEIQDRIRNLCCRVLPRKSAPLEAVQYYARALRLGLDRSQAAYVHKKMAECYLDAGRREEAIAALRTAFQLSPTMKGARRICERLGFDPSAP